MKFEMVTTPLRKLIGRTFHSKVCPGAYFTCNVWSLIFFAFLPAAQDLIRKLLTVDPAERITVNEAMVSMDAMDVFVSI